MKFNRTGFIFSIVFVIGIATGWGWGHQRGREDSREALKISKLALENCAGSVEKAHEMFEATAKANGMKP